MPVGACSGPPNAFADNRLGFRRWLHGLPETSDTDDGSFVDPPTGLRRALGMRVVPAIHVGLLSLRRARSPSSRRKAAYFSAFVAVEALERRRVLAAVVPTDIEQYM